jgi:hypothetical protein
MKVESAHSATENRRPRKCVKRMVSAALLLLLLAAGVLYIRTKPGRDAAALQAAFDTAWQATDYREGMAIYTTVQEKSLEKETFLTRPREFEIIKLEMETIIFAAIDEILERLVTQDQPALTAEEITFLKGVEGLAVPRLTGTLHTVSTAVLEGRTEPDHARAVFTALESSGLIPDQIAEFKQNVSAMEAVRDRYTAALELKRSNDQLGAALKLREILDDRSVKTTGYAYEQVSLLFYELTDELKPDLMQELSVMIENDRVFTANTFLVTLRKLYPGDAVLAAYEQEVKRKIPENLVAWRGQVVHLVVNPLITRPAAAFDGDRWSDNADLNRLTGTEFERMLEQLYQQGYMLISESSLLKADGSFKSISLPQGKKPLILTISGLSYPITVRQQGTAERLVYDPESNLVLCEYINVEGERVVDEGGESVCILNRFVRAHPDFSFDGAKGTIAVRGAYDIFGYVTTEAQATASRDLATLYGLPPETYDTGLFANHQQAVGRIAKHLKEQGWEFASYGYSESSMTELTPDEIRSEAAAWRSTVGSLVGDTKIFVYPNNHILPGNDERSQALQESGFRIFNGIGPKPFLYNQENYIYMDCQMVSGSILRSNRLDWLLQTADIYDAARTVPYQ